MRAFHLVIAGLVSSLALGCASGTKSEVGLEEKLQREPMLATSEEIASRGADIFMDAPNLNPEQRRKLMDIYANTYSQASAMRAEIGQSKSLLFKLISSTDYKSRDVRSLKNKIVGLEKKRLDAMFKALDEVQKVVGYGKETEKIYNRFEEFGIPRSKSVE